MSNYGGFKPNPKQLVVNKAKTLFGGNVKIDITGTRMSPLECKQLEIPVGSYYVECFLDKKLIAVAQHGNWRKAYNLLTIEVEKYFELELHAV